MAMQFSHSVGYRGVCKLYEKIKDSEKYDMKKPIIVLCTGGNINLSQDPIMSGGVWGAGYANAAPIAYAWNYLNLEGSVNFELTKGKVWSALKDYAFDSRTAQHPITLLPDGKNGFQGNGWLSSLSFDASEGQAITGTFNFRGDPDAEEGGIKAEGEGDDSALGVTWSEGDSSGSGAPPLDISKVGIVGASLIPYWETTVGYYDTKQNKNQKLEDIISWSCSYNSDIQLLKCCNAQGSAPLSADYILLGEMSGDGNFTVFKIKGEFNPNKYHYEKKYLTFGIGSKSKSIKPATMEITDTGSVSNVYNYIQIPLAIVNSASTSMTTGASYVTAECSFTALGDGKNSIITMSDGSWE